MQNLTGNFIARAHVSPDLELLQSQEPLTSLQIRCGGEFPGQIAIPELREALKTAQRTDQKIARSFAAFDGENKISAWVEVFPYAGEGGGWLLGIANWQSRELLPEDETTTLQRRRDIDRSVAELAARLDENQNLLAVNIRGEDLQKVKANMDANTGHPWTDFVTFPGSTFRKPLHWRLLDGSVCHIEGSEREWTASLVPLGVERGKNPTGFELYLVPDRSYQSERVATPKTGVGDSTQQSVGRDLAPVLRQPIARIVANAETIRARLAGPLPEEYGEYASDIASAGQYLLSLLDDLADLEVVESPEFKTAPDSVDLVDISQRAIGILAVRAQEKNIEIEAPPKNAKVQATAEFRRVLQILINLLSNAIRYAPEKSVVTIRAGETDNGSWISIADQGPGLTDAQQAVIFNKFERLGRSGDGGSGLGLYISHRIAEAMGGSLTVKSSPGEGACFTLTVPPG